MKKEKRASEIIVSSGKYLSDVIKELPHGIFNKSEPGLGATTLELKCERHSIIVEPLKVTASSKAKKHNACYVGSATKFHPDKDKGANMKRITKHLEDTSIQHKKFVTVADSLDTLIAELGKSKNDYFLLIDEADRTQLDVGFRFTMEKVLKCYKTHPKSKRCLMTATPIHFNDPELQHEPYHVCKLEKPVRRNINLVTTNTGPGVIIDKVLDIYKNSTDKVVIAINEVALSREMANELVKEGVDKKDVQILCSNASEKKAGEFYKQLDSSKLKSRITFKTSAYFNGFDIDERYHLFTYIHPFSTQHILSDKIIKQIAGRCRDKKGPLSETIIYQNASIAERREPHYTLEELKNEAQILIDALACVDKHFKHSIKLKQQAATIFDDFSKSTSIYGYPLINTRETSPSISYLSIDAILEMNKVINTQYCKPDAMFSVLSSENDVTTHHTKSAREISASTARAISITEEKEQVKEALTELIDQSLASGNKAGFAPSFSQLTDNGHYNARYALELYNSFRLNVDNLQLKEHILSAFENKQVHAKLKKLNKTLTFICADDSDTIKKAVSAKFEIGNSYTTAEVQELMLTLYEDFGRQKITNYKPKVLVENFRMLVDAKLNPNKKISGRIYKVKGYNTLGITVYNSQKEHLTKSEAFMELLDSAFV